jgi:2-phosphosulfolactate phosphatase
MKTIHVLLAPAEFEHFAPKALDDTACVVFDILRATSTIVTALANGAKVILPAVDIPEALELKRLLPDALLAGERDGLRIHAGLTGGTEFDLGNSPREFTREKVDGKKVIITTTNGSRALKACSHAPVCFAAAFLNMAATTERLRSLPQNKLLMVCSGTGSKSSYEDTLAAGAMVDALLKSKESFDLTDSARIALQIYLQQSKNLMHAMEYARNGRRLLGMPQLASDVALCLRQNIYSFIAQFSQGAITRE